MSTTCSASGAAPTLSPSLQLFPADAVLITGTNKYLYKNYYNDRACTKPSSGQAYPLNVCKPYVLDGKRQYRLVTAATSRNTTSLVYYREVLFDDSACTIYSGERPDGSNTIYSSSPSTMKGVTGTCQPDCKRYRTATMAGITTSLSSVMPSSGQLIPPGYTAISSSGYIQQITYKDKACSNVMSSFATQLNTCFSIVNGLFAMYTAGSSGSQSLSSTYSIRFGLYADSTCTQMLAFTDNDGEHYLYNDQGEATCTTTNLIIGGLSQKMLISSYLPPSFPSTGAIVR
jgi:hypothetical protein